MTCVADPPCNTVAEVVNTRSLGGCGVVFVLLVRVLPVRVSLVRVLLVRVLPVRVLLVNVLLVQASPVQSSPRNTVCPIPGLFYTGIYFLILKQENGLLELKQFWLLKTLDGLLLFAYGCYGSNMISQAREGRRLIFPCNEELY